MTEQGEAAAPRSALRAFAVAILIGVWLRLLTSVVAGIVDIAGSDPGYFPHRTAARVGDILVTLGGAGDGTGVVLTVAALAILWLLHGSALDTDRLRVATATAFGLTALLAFAATAGFWLLFSVATDDVVWSRLVSGTGSSLAVAIVALGGAAATRTLPVAAAERRQSSGFTDDPFVFAVDRHSGDVHAYFSADEAARRTHVFAVEDGEYAFYADDGTVIAATVEQDQIMLRPTMSTDPDGLLQRLKEFVTRRGINVAAADADDTTAYVVPINDWQWLELWPGWLRWMGRLVRRRP